ncbi:MAG: UDP-N-acetylglucosamine diphosphorylase/glucosamine-1-phosphate N-acetyltransferase [Aquificae bacterium]|nr:UDP-N-acetylglucosamine diphosphorylase/glucosamine-1-phosphate N-acetyltransferase [Aquificota bacterium]
MRAIVLAAGLGTRFRSEKPKVLHEILGKPMLWYVITNVRNGKIDEIALVVGHKAQEVMEAFKDENLKFFIQKNPKGGTADAVLSAKDFFASYDGYVLIINGDSPLVSGETIRNMQQFIYMVKAYEGVKLGGVVLTAHLPDPTGYGRVLKEPGTDRVLRIVEEKDASAEEKRITEVNAGVYIFYAPWLLEALYSIKPSRATGELYLTDVVEYMSKKGYEVRSFMAREPSEVIGVNTRWELAIAENLIKLKLIKFWTDRGVTVHFPETVWIEPDVSLENDVEIFPGAQLKGKTKVGKGSVIGSGSVIVDSTIGRNVRIGEYTVVERSRVEDGAVLGPFARIRDGAHVRSGAHIGNFVEVKKSVIGEDVRAKHLAYIGDATLGKGVNVGAGVVFANYDGKRKHESFVGERAFLGSNSLIVAPVKIGSFSFIAGGSVVNKDVPDYAFVISRPELRIIPEKGKKFLDK